MRGFFWFSVVVCLWAPVRCWPEDSASGTVGDAAQEEVFPDLDLTAAEASSWSVDKILPDNWIFGGNVTQKIHYAYRDQLQEYGFSRDDSGIAVLRLGLRLRLEGAVTPRFNFGIGMNSFYDFAYEREDKKVSDEEFDVMSKEFELRDAFLQFEIFDGLWLKTGRQIVAWGESDFAQVVDLVNPRDERDLGLQDLEDARLPIAASRLTYVGNRWGADLVITHEFEPNRYAGQAADFDPLIRLQNLFPQRRSEEPDVGLDNPGVLARVFYSHAKGDISLMGGRVFSRQPVPVPSLSAADEVVLQYPEIEVLGATLSFIEGYWLLKFEMAAKSGLQFLATESSGADPPSLSLTAVEKSVYEILAGFEFSPFQDLQLTSEILSTLIDGHEKNLNNKRVESILSSRMNFEFLRDTANLELVWLEWLDGGDGRSYRLGFEYDISDMLEFSIGFINFSSSDEGSALFPFRNNDRVFSGITFNF